ncbi:hypothetical protein D3C76_1311820 [compost metagenome]
MEQNGAGNGFPIGYLISGAIAQGVKPHLSMMIALAATFLTTYKKQILSVKTVGIQSSPLFLVEIRLMH